ncbi:MAG: hypothetical protein R3F11_00760 [Verrucomicrobiales bacterium]
MLVSLARQMTKYRLPKLALETLKRAAALNKSPEVAVEIELESADAEAAAGEAAAASGRLDALLGKVAPDYWRRPEIVVKRVALIDSDAEREAMLQKARRLCREPGPAKCRARPCRAALRLRGCGGGARHVAQVPRKDSALRAHRGAHARLARPARRFASRGGISARPARGIAGIAGSRLSFGQSALRDGQEG